jgi:hypothetical protein
LTEKWRYRADFRLQIGDEATARPRVAQYRRRRKKAKGRVRGPAAFNKSILRIDNGLSDFRAHEYLPS